MILFARPGDLDHSFDSDGIVTTKVGDTKSYGRGVAVQDNQKIIIAGYAKNAQHDNFALVRYNPDGSLDTGFGKDNNGKIITPVGSIANRALCLAIQRDGKIVIAGYAYGDNSWDFGVVRYTKNGDLDPDFGTDGKVTTAIRGNDDEAYSVSIQSDGKIVVSGYSNDGNKNDFAIVRYDINGSLDPGFGIDGTVVTSVTDDNDKAYTMTIQNNGKIITAGYAKINSNHDVFALVRYDADGALDLTFGTNGKITTAVGNKYDYIKGIAVQSNGKIVVAGDSQNGESYDFAIVRYKPDGTLDKGFGIGGKVTNDIAGKYDTATSIAIQDDGKNVAAGYSQNENDDKDFTVLRYEGDPVILSPIYYLLQ